MLRHIGKIAKRRLLGRRLPDIVRSVRAESLTYLDDDALIDLYEQVSALEKQTTKGILVEAGCALGGSAIVMATAKSKRRPFFVYDVFGMIPSPSELDEADVHERYAIIESGQAEGIGGNKYYGYEENLLDKVAENFNRHSVPVEANNVHLVKGLFEDTLAIEEPVAMAHVDSDWYGSVMTCLQRIEPHLVSGAVLVIDDYYHWSGCRKAVDEYFEDKQDRYDFIRRSRMHIIRK
jgi:O-methyltransferase